MGGVIDAIGGATKDFVKDPWSIAVPMYGITKGMVKMANGDYSNPQTGEVVPAAQAEQQPPSPAGAVGPMNFSQIADAQNAYLAAHPEPTYQGFSPAPSYHGKSITPGFIDSMAGAKSKAHSAGLPNGAGSEAFGSMMGKKAPFAGAWDYQASKGPSWSGPKNGNSI